MECFSLISAELYFDSCRETNLLTFIVGRSGDVASLLIEPLLTRKVKIHICLQIERCSIVTLQS